MPFKDSKEGQTHYFGDGCKPPHRCPEGTCRKDYGVTCKVCNNEMLPATAKEVSSKLSHAERSVTLAANDLRENQESLNNSNIIFNQEPEDWVHGFRMIGEGSVRFMATREEVIEYFRKVIESKQREAREEIILALSHMGMGLSNVDADNTEYEKGYYGGIEDAVSIVRNPLP